LSQGRDTNAGRVVVGIAGVEGLDYGVGVLEALRRSRYESHLVLTPAAEEALDGELDSVRALADQVYAPYNQAARISSGSFLTLGMVVAPCDAHSLASIVLGLATNLVYRAADVTLKERRPLVLGLAPAPATSIALEHLDRARGVPGLVARPLAGPAEPAAGDLLAHLETALGDD
jgi:4-hydroxy-3-polyprenylbenzoate decarboxylase